MKGDYIKLGEDSGGWRDFLDGKPIHCGDQLQLWTGERWVYARYEMGDRIDPDFSLRFPKMACKAYEARLIEKSSKKQSVILPDLSRTL